MEIDIGVEQLISLEDAAKLPAFTRLVDGKPKHAHLASIYRAIKTGSRGSDGKLIKLESIRSIGGMRTSLEAVERFVSRLNGIEPGAKPAPTKKQRAKQIEKAELACSAAGI